MSYAITKRPPAAPPRRARLQLVSRKGMGAAALLVRPGPNGGTEIVDPSGNIVYSADQVAADPSLLSQPSSVCADGEMATWFPGNESVCADQSAVVPGEGNSPFAQYTDPINGSCPVDGWCFTGTNPSDPNSYTWQGGGTPTTLNPALVMTQPALPSTYTQPAAPAAAANPPNFVSTAPATSATSTPAPAAKTYTASIALNNLSRPGQSFQVGDLYQVVISGAAPNAPVTNSASQNGASLGTTSYGSTDGSGNFTISGTLQSEHVGSWIEQWTVGGTQQIRTLSFSVTAAPGTTAATTTTDSSSSSSSASTGTPVGSNYAVLPAASLPAASWFTDSTIVSFAPNWAVLLAGGVAAVAFVFGGKR